MDEEKKPATHKMLTAILLFIVLGLLTSQLLSYNKTSEIGETQEKHKVVEDELLENSRKQMQQIEQLTIKVTNLENKLDNLEKTGKLNK